MLITCVQYQYFCCLVEELEDEKESSENEADSDHARGMQTDPWPKKTVQEGPPSQQSLCHLISTSGGPERSGCETPVSVDSIPLEWDHTGDVGGSSSPEDEEEDSFFSALSGKFQPTILSRNVNTYKYTNSYTIQIHKSSYPAFNFEPTVIELCCAPNSVIPILSITQNEMER